MSKMRKFTYFLVFFSCLLGFFPNKHTLKDFNGKDSFLFQSQSTELVTTSDIVTKKQIYPSSFYHLLFTLTPLMTFDKNFFLYKETFKKQTFIPIFIKIRSLLL